MTNSVLLVGLGHSHRISLTAAIVSVMASRRHVILLVPEDTIESGMGLEEIAAYATPIKVSDIILLPVEKPTELVLSPEERLNELAGSLGKLDISQMRAVFSQQIAIADKRPYLESEITQPKEAHKLSFSKTAFVGGKNLCSRKRVPQRNVRICGQNYTRFDR